MLYYVYLYLLILTINYYIINTNSDQLKVISNNIKIKSNDNEDIINTLYNQGISLINNKQYNQAADILFKAIVLLNNDINNKTKKYNTKHSIQSLYQEFMNVFIKQNLLENAYLYIAKQYGKNGQIDSAMHQINESIKIKPTPQTYIYLAEIESTDDKKQDAISKALDLLNEIDDPPADLYIKIGDLYYAMKRYKRALKSFEEAIEINPSSNEAISNAVYLRTNICQWGRNGSIFYNDMNKLTDIVKYEMNTKMLNRNTVEQQSVIHPHMSLSYHIDPIYKLAIARSHARTEEYLIRSNGIEPINHINLLLRYRLEYENPQFRLKVGYVSANFKSKTTIYMAQNLLGFHNKEKFEIHAFATSAPDTKTFLEKAMRGVDWRNKVKNSIEYFHDVSNMKVDELSNYIRDQGIHILLDWDGYSNNGVRATGLFPQQPAPIQIAHQAEYIGTMGADYIQYIITDKIASPMHLQQNYNEKFIWMPYCFLANSFAYQSPHMSTPTKQIDKKLLKQLLTNYISNKSNYTIANQSISYIIPKNKHLFTYCNFNKHLKFNPLLTNTWLKLLESNKHTILLLLENPIESIDNFYSYVMDYNRSLINRIYFLPFIANPYDNQFRVSRLCSVVLDNEVYNSHTTAMDALWGGVPLITLGNGVDMSGRVTLSILTTLELPDLIAEDYDDYYYKALYISNNKTYYNLIRSHIVNSCNQDNPKHQLWDLQRYTRNLESGYLLAWEKFLRGESPQHIEIIDYLTVQNNITILYNKPFDSSTSNYSTNVVVDLDNDLFSDIVINDNEEEIKEKQINQNSTIDIIKPFDYNFIFHKTTKCFQYNQRSCYCNNN